MGMVFGRESVAEPVYKVLAITKRSGSTTIAFPYELRQYGLRMAAETAYQFYGNDSNGEPFRLLANYIGVFGKPHNEGSNAVAMTAPVAMKELSAVPIAMTAPVAMKGSKDTTEGQQRTMTFFLPAEYTTLESVPKPTNPAVTIRAVPAATGAVHRFSGTMDPQKARTVALKLGQQLRDDGVTDCTDEFVLQRYESWAYNPPFTLPPFRRNEVWIELTTDQVKCLVSDSVPSTDLN